MSRIVVIGGSGLAGTYLVPMLVELGHQVVNVSRGSAKPYCPHSAWSAIENVSLDRVKEEEQGTFGKKIADLKPDIVIDMIAFDLNRTRQVVEALKGKIEHYLFCSSIWVYGRYVSVPSLETDPVCPIDAYGQGKAESEAWLMREARLSGFPATCFRPGDIVGEGWVPTTPQGNSNPDVYSRIARGETLILPNLGSETVHHVHAIDVAQLIIKAIENRSASVGEIFNAVSGQAITRRGFAEQSSVGLIKSRRLSFSLLTSGLQDLNQSLLKTQKGMLSGAHHIQLRKRACVWIMNLITAVWRLSMSQYKR